jgi:hypothetical protein
VAAHTTPSSMESVVQRMQTHIASLETKIMEDARIDSPSQAASHSRCWAVGQIVSSVLEVGPWRSEISEWKNVSS